MSTIHFDESKSHIMSSHVRGDGYAIFVWPKNLTLRELDYVKEIVNMQIDCFRNYAKKETEQEEAARLEYESWI